MAVGCAIEIQVFAHKLQWCVGEDTSTALALGGWRVGESIWVPLVATVVGGALALVGSIWATRATLRAQERTRKHDREQAAADRAYVVIWKMLDAYNAAEDLQRHINEAYDNADRSGRHDIEPWAKVVPLVGNDFAPKDIDPSETSFLIDVKQAALMNEVHLVQRRLASILVSSREYGRRRGEMHEFLMAKIEGKGIVDGSSFAAEVSSDIKFEIETREGILNNLLGQIMQRLHEDLPHTWDVIGQFQKAAQERFGNKFPSFEMGKKTDEDAQQPRTPCT